MDDNTKKNFEGWICGGIAAILFVWFVLAAIVHLSGIRAIEISDRHIRLTNVHDDFVAAVRENRRPDRDVGGRRRTQYDDVRDDDDDRPRRRSRD